MPSNPDSFVSSVLRFSVRCDSPSLSGPVPFRRHCMTNPGALPRRCSDGQSIQAHCTRPGACDPTIAGDNLCKCIQRISIIGLHMQCIPIAYAKSRRWLLQTAAADGMNDCHERCENLSDRATQNVAKKRSTASGSSSVVSMIMSAPCSSSSPGAANPHRHPMDLTPV